MSILKDFENLSIVKDLDKWFKKVFSTTAPEQEIIAAAGAVAPLIETGLALGNDAAAIPQVSKAFTEIQTDLGLFVSLVKTSGTSPSAQSILAAIQSNLSGLLTDAGVKNASNFSSLSALISSLLAELQVVAAFFPAATVVAAA